MVCITAESVEKPLDEARNRGLYRGQTLSGCQMEPPRARFRRRDTRSLARQGLRRDFINTLGSYMDQVALSREKNWGQRLIYRGGVYFQMRPGLRSTTYMFPCASSATPSGLTNPPMVGMLFVSYVTSGLPPEESS